MTWALDYDTIRHHILDLVGAQDPPLRRDLLESMVRSPGESVAVERTAANVGAVHVRDTAGEWHMVGTVDFSTFEREAPGDWN